ncbi:Outer membrane vitamin B12 receptor BtuB [hydrothermal vent metagenome]|uniref:Outer membrane vitamin B12 receptor BtuB n=1 Tax=hydrothermal vent metagenome TaxID=652676 RepID=A0A1W1E0Q4_9ZZZZ
MKKIILASAITLTTALSNAALGPIPIYMNTEYRTDNPVIGSIASTLTFSADDIQATGANTFLDFLVTVPSVGLFNATGNTPAVFMRGSNSNHTLVLIDGVSIHDISSTGGSAGYGLANISLNDIEKIEIIKGSGSVLYGSSAIAGVISIITKKSADGTHGTVSVKAGTHNSKTYALSASGGSKDGFIRFTHNKYTTDGVNARTNDATNEKDGIDNQSTQIKAGNEFFDIAYLQSRNKAEYDNTDAPDQLGDRKLNKIAVNMNKKINDIWKAKLSIAQTKSSRNVYSTGVLQNWSTDKYKSTNITILNDVKINNALLNIGLSQVEDKNITDDKKSSSKDLFINWQKNINSVDLNIGARHIKHNEFDNHTIYNAGIGKYLGKGIKLTANYNTAFNAPSLYQSDYGKTGKLKPETSKNINFGLSKQHPWGKVSIDLYKNTIANKISYTGTYPNDFYNNIDELNIKGIELSINAHISKYNVDFSHDYNQSRQGMATTTGSPVTQSVRRPQNTTNLTISKQYGKFNSSVQIIKKSSALDISSNANLSNYTKLSGYTLLNLSTNYNINDATQVSLNIKNATDKDYTTAVGYNQLGRTVELGLNYKF